MGRLAWTAFVLVQVFGELGPWAGLHMKSALGPALWFAGIVVMMPGRLLALWLEQVFWGVRLTPVQTTAVFVAVEVAANVVFWLLCARCWRFARRRRAVPVRSEQ